MDSAGFPSNHYAWKSKMKTMADMEFKSNSSVSKL